SAFRDVKSRVAINSDVTSQLHVVRRGIVLCVVSVNIRVSDMNGDVIAGCCQPIFIRGLPRRSDFDGSILRSFDFSVDQTSTRKQTGEQQNQRSHGERQTYRSKLLMQRQNNL